MQVKTIMTAAGVNEIDFGNDSSQSTAHFYWLKNLGDSTLYVSANPNPIAEKDDVAELPAKGAVSVETDEGKIYVLGAGKVEIHRTNSKFCPFDWQSSGSGGGGGGSITVDSELSDTSTNPLQNKVTTAAINEVNSTVKTLEAVLTQTQEDVSANTAALETKSDLDHTHDISASGNPIIMDNLQGGVPFSEITVSGKNLLTLSISTLTANGITATANDDGSITLSGTATANTYIGMWDFLYARNMGVGKIAINAIDGQSISTYYMGVDRREGNSYIDRIAQSITDNGIGKITQEDVENNRNFYVWVCIRQGYTCNNLIIYPQLELGDTATAYEPPITGRELQVNVSGKNLISGNIINKTGTVTDNSDSWIIEWTAAMYVRFDKIFLKPNTDYTISWWQKSDNGTDCVKIGVINGDDKSPIIEQSSAEIKTGAEYTLCSFTFNSGNNRNIYVQFLRASATGTVYVKKSIQLELGSTATAYEPYHGSTTTITPDSNPYIVPNDIRQQDGYNVVSVSEGELSVVGVQKNAAIKRIWDDMSMDLLFDGVTSANNPAVIDLANYNMIRIDVGGNFEGTSYFNCGSTYFLKSTLDYAVTSYGCVAMAMSNQAVVINISKSGADYSLSFTGFNAKQLVEVIKIFGIK